MFEKNTKQVNQVHPLIVQGYAGSGWKRMNKTEDKDIKNSLTDAQKKT